MTALPIVTRELRIIARRPSTYWIRFVIGLLATVIGGCMLSFTTSLNMGAMAKQMLFSMISSVVGIYAFFAGIRNTADCLSVEKREGTLGLLFLTDLKGYDVVLGKLSSASIHSLYGMIAAFPIFGVALIGGGITGAEFLRASLAIVNVVFFAHAAGLVVSAYSLNGRRAMGASLFIGFLMIWGLPVATAILAVVGWHHTAQWLGQLSPVNALHLALISTPISAASIMFGGGLPGLMRVNFWSALAVSHLLGWLFILIASWHAPRSWQNVDIKLNWRARIQHKWYGSVAARNAFRRELVGINPFYWLASRSRFEPHTTWGALVTMSCLILWLFLKVGIDLTALSITLIVALHLIIRIGIASSASRHFAEQRKNGALEFLLACTPLDTKDLVRGQWLALRRVFLIPTVFVLSLDFGLLIIVLSTQWRPNSMLGPDGLLPYALFVVAMMMMLVLDAVALGWAGMWTGISTNLPNRAPGLAAARIMGYPFAWTCVVSGIITALLEIRNIQQPGYVFLALWFGIGAGFDIFWIFYSRSAIYRKFRTLAATPYEKQTGLIAALGRALGRTWKSRARTGSPELPPAITM